MRMNFAFSGSPKSLPEPPFLSNSAYLHCGMFLIFELAKQAFFCELFNYKRVDTFVLGPSLLTEKPFLKNSEQLGILALWIIFIFELAKQAFFCELFNYTRVNMLCSGPTSFDRKATLVTEKAFRVPFDVVWMWV